MTSNSRSIPSPSLDTLIPRCASPPSISAPLIKLKISPDGLAPLHPADIADIVEDLAPDEREAVFRTLDEDVAAETLEEVDPKVQRSIVESLDSERAADIVEEMDPDAAADLLADLSQDHTE